MPTFEDTVRTSLRAVADYAPRQALPASVQARATARRLTPRAVAVTAVATAVLLVAVGVWAVNRGTHATPVAVTVGGHQMGEAEAFPSGPLSTRIGATSVWTGSEWLIWGGLDPTNRPLADGASYDPTDKRWTALPPAPLEGREEAASVWTGHNWIIYGGGTDHPFLNGAAFDPETGRWQPLPSSPPSLEDVTNSPPEAVWTGTEMIVVVDDSAAAYDPTSRRWTALPALPGLSTEGHQAVWTGTDALFLVGDADPTPSPSDPSTPSLAVGATTTAPTTTTSPPTINLPGSTGKPFPAGPDRSFPGGPGYHLVDFHLSTDAWTLIPSGGLTGDLFPAVVWTGSALLSIDPPSGTNASYSFRTKQWTQLPAPPKGTPSPAAPDSVVQWTGTELVLWTGGRTGFTYTPAINTWSTFSGINLAGLFPGLAVTTWTGHALLLWGAVGDGSSGDTRAVSYQPGG